MVQNNKSYQELADFCEETLKMHCFAFLEISVLCLNEISKAFNLNIEAHKDSDYHVSITGLPPFENTSEADNVADELAKCSKVVFKNPKATAR